MNKKAKTLIAKIDYEITEASARFELLLSLFGSKKNLNIINDSSPAVFHYIRNSLQESLILGLNRLCDRPKDVIRKRINHNISLEALLVSLPSGLPKNKALCVLLEKQLRVIKKEVTKLNKFRSKRIAHNDRRTHTGNYHIRIQNSAIDKAIDEMQNFTNLIHKHFEDRTIRLVNPSYPLKDGPNRLMRLLKVGIDANRAGAHNVGKRSPLS